MIDSKSVHDRSILSKVESPDWLYIGLPFAAIIMGFGFFIFTDTSLFTSSLASLSITYGSVILGVRFYHYLRK